MTFAVEIRLALRRLAARPGVTLLAVGLLAAGLGAQAFVVSLYEQVALRELPVERPGELFLARLVGSTTAGRGAGTHPVAYADFLELEAATRDELPLAAWGTEPALLTLDAGTERVATAWVSPRFFALVGARPLLGALFDPARDPRHPAPEVVLSHAAWLRRFGGDPGVLGRGLRIDGSEATVIGVLPRELRGIEPGAAPELYRLAAGRTESWTLFTVLGRVSDGGSRASVADRLTALHAEIVARDPGRRSFVMVDGKMTEARMSVTVEPGARGLVGSTALLERLLLLVGGMVALVLAIVVANLAQLFAARAALDERHAAIRVALGATRWQVARRWIVEAALLALAGAGLGVWVVGGLGPRLLAWQPSPDLALSYEIAADPLVVAATALLVVGIAVGTSALAIWESRRLAPGERLRGESASATADRRRARGRQWLVGAQVALGTTLVAATGLLVRSLDALVAIDPGFRLSDVASFRIDLAERDPERARERELAALPGVDAVAASPMTVLAGMRSFSLLAIESYEPPPGEATMIESVAVTPRFFDVLGLRALAGELPPAGEDPARRRAVVNATFAARYLGGAGTAIGRRLAYGAGARSWGEPGDDELTVAAVVADSVIADPRESPAARLYAPFDGGFLPATLYLRSARPLAALAPELRRVVGALAPDAALFDLRTLADRRDERLARERFLRDLAAGLGGFAALLAATGLGGVLAFLAATRRRELAIRAALGAPPRRLGLDFLAAGLRPVAAGLAAGVALAPLAGRLLASFLHGVRPHDPASIALAAALLGGVAIVASLPSTWSTLRADPARALREP